MSTLLLSQLWSTATAFDESRSFSCETREFSTGVGAASAELGTVACAPGELLVAGEVVHSDGMNRCNTVISAGADGVRRLIAGCGAGSSAWLARISCCRLPAEAELRSCTSRRLVAGKERPVPAEWEKVCCSRGTLTSAYVYLHQNGRGNCPVRTVVEGGNVCASVRDCGLPSAGNEWALEMVCCAPD